MKKNIIYILLAALTLGSCSEDFLDKSNPNQIGEESFWSSKSDAEYALVGCYDALQSGQMYGGGVYSSGMRDHDCLSDNSYNAWEWQGLENIADGSIDYSHWLLSGFWENSYKGIVRCNEVIHNVPNIEMDKDDIDRVVAEARFLRALYYFNLSNAFGQVPLILDVQAVDNADVAKNTEREIFDAVIDDLKYAADKLSNYNYSHADKGAALSLLAKVYLYDQKYDLAAEAAKKVIDLKQYSLFDDYSSLFTVANEVNNEVVFTVRFGTGFGDNNGESFSGTWAKVPQTHHQPMPNFIDDFYCTDGLPIDESPLYNSNKKNENRDPRLEATIIFPGEVWIDGGSPFNKKKTKTGYAMQKYIRNEVGFLSDGPQDFYVIRYADVLLMRAEALIESDNTSQEIYDLINEVRDRVGMPHVEAVEGAGLSKDQLRKVLRHERRVEFGLEGTRYYDLKRWGTLQEAVTRANADAVSGHLMVFEGEKTLCWPLPQSEVDNNKLLDQNPNW